MKAKISPATVGMFVLGAVVLGLVGFLSFGGSNIFSKPSRFLIYFDESVSGLELGAAVKLNGVRVGRVAAISVRYETTEKRATVRTVCEIDREVLTDFEGRTIELTDPVEFQNLIDRGLRARLNLQGITGLLFVELDFEEPRKYPANPAHMADVYPVVPAIPSPISELQTSVVEIVADIKRVDFPGLSAQMKTLLATANGKIAEVDLKALADRLARAAEAVETFVGSPEAKEVFVNLNAAVGEARATLAKIDAQVEPVGSDLRQTIAEARAAIETIDRTALSTREFVENHSELGVEVTRAMRQLADAAAALERLADFIGRNPNALLVGKKNPE